MEILDPNIRSRIAGVMGTPTTFPMAALHKDDATLPSADPVKMTHMLTVVGNVETMRTGHWATVSTGIGSKDDKVVGVSSTTANDKPLAPRGATNKAKKGRES
jgi:hypothetical protein